MLTIADDLIILTVGLKARVGPNNGLLSPAFARAVRGAELIALASAGRVDVAGGAIRVRDATPLGDPGLDAALAAASPGTANRAEAGSTAPAVEVRTWMNAAPYGSVTARFERLAGAGLLRGERYMLLLMVPRIGYRLANELAVRRFEELRARLHAAVTAPGPLDSDRLALVGLVHAGAIAHFAYPGKAGAPARGRIAVMARDAGLAAGASGQPTLAPSPGLDPNLLFPSTPGSAEHHHHHHPSASHAPQPAVQAAISSAVQAAVAASVSAAVAATIETAVHHHASGGSGSMDSTPVHHHH